MCLFIEAFSCRLWDDCWESTSVCSDPGSQQQQRKLKQRALQAEIQSLHRSLVSLKRGIHMAAAQRPGSNSKIPLPPGHLQHIQQSSSSGQGPGTPAASVEWEDLDLRSSSPSAASVEGLSKDGLARKPVRISSRHTQVFQQLDAASLVVQFPPRMPGQSLCPAYSHKFPPRFLYGLFDILGLLCTG